MTEQAISPLRRRMIEDMTIRKFAQKTQHEYVQRVKDFASYLHRSPDTANPEDVRAAFRCIWRRAAPAFQRSTPQDEAVGFSRKACFSSMPQKLFQSPD